MKKVDLPVTEMEGWWEGLVVAGMSGLSLGFATFEILIRYPGRGIK